MRKVFFILFILLLHNSYAAVDTISVFSSCMQKQVKCVVITPADHKNTKERFPIVYLLHGYSGSYSNWITKVPSLDSFANVYRMIIVCPDAAYSSWYFDSPVDSSSRYETFTSKELPVYIDANYQTTASKKGRAITGLSMGGHGAIFLTLRNPEIFGACGSMSGVMDLSKEAKRFDLAKRLGDSATNHRYFTDWSVVNLVNTYDPKDSIAFIIDCGIRDFTFDGFKATHEKMLQLKIPHDYIERPGTHDWKYWINAVRYQLLFFREWFNRNM